MEAVRDLESWRCWILGIMTVQDHEDHGAAEGLCVTECQLSGGQCEQRVTGVICQAYRVGRREDGVAYCFVFVLRSSRVWASAYSPCVGVSLYAQISLRSFLHTPYIQLSIKILYFHWIGWPVQILNLNFLY